MFKDLEKTIGLVKNTQLGAPNFLLALGLCCFTEYWGGCAVNDYIRGLENGTEKLSCIEEALKNKAELV